MIIYLEDAKKIPLKSGELISENTTALKYLKYLYINLTKYV